VRASGAARGENFQVTHTGLSWNTPKERSGKGLEREIGARDEAVVEQRRHDDVDEHEHPDVAGAGGFAEGDKIVPAAIEEAVRVDRLVARAAR
jgi:hypothetical protein